MNKHLKTGPSLLVSVLFLIYVFNQVQIDQVLLLLKQSRLDLLLLAAGLVGFIPLAAAYRWHSVLRILNPGNTFSQALKQTMAANVLNTLVPSKLGDLIKSLGHKHVTKRLGLSAVIFERSVDLGVLGLLSLVGGIYLHLHLSFILGLALLGIPFILVFASQLVSRILKPLSSYNQITSKIRHQPVHLLPIIYGSIMVWSLNISIALLLLYALIGRFPLLIVLFKLPTAIIMGLIPLSVSGIGTRDVALNWLLSDNIGNEASTALGILYTIFVYWLLALWSLPLTISNLPKYWRLIKHEQTK